MIPKSKSTGKNTQRHCSFSHQVVGIKISYRAQKRFKFHCHIHKLRLHFEEKKVSIILLVHKIEVKQQKLIRSIFQEY